MALVSMALESLALAPGPMRFVTDQYLVGCDLCLVDWLKPALAEPPTSSPGCVCKLGCWQSQTPLAVRDLRTANLDDLLASSQYAQARQALVVCLGPFFQFP